MTIVISAAGSLCCHGQMNVTSPAATDFVKYERIPVSYFNGLPSIDIPLYTLDYKDLHLPIHLSYYASGIQLNQYPTCVGLGWNLSAGGCITRVVNGIPDETCAEDVKDQTGDSYSGTNPGYYFSSKNLDRDDWASENRLLDYVNSSLRFSFDWDLQPDEFVINAYGVSGSVYFYRDKDNNLKSRVKSNNGESFRVEPPVLVHNPKDIIFSGDVEPHLKAYRVYELFYKFTVIKNDGTKLIFGGDYDSIEFYTEKMVDRSVPSGHANQYLKTRPTSWMLREVVSPNGNKMTFEYQRSGSPIIISDVRKDLATYKPNGTPAIIPSQDSERGISFIVQHPVYPQSISVEGGPVFNFMTFRSKSLNTVGSNYEKWMQDDGFSDHMIDFVDYSSPGSSDHIPYAPHNYSQQLSRLDVVYNGIIQRSFEFSYTSDSSERLKLTGFDIRGGTAFAEQRYSFKYNDLRLPPYNATVTDNWGYWNNRDYRKTSISNNFFKYRSSDEYYTKAEVLTEIQYPTGGHVSFDYELNDYSLVATQAPDFKILEQSGRAGGLRIKEIVYSTDTASYVHAFEYRNEDGSSSGILSGIPVYVAEGNNYYSYDYSSWQGLVHFHDKAEVRQAYKMWSEAYINALGLTTGNYVTYSRVLESVGDVKPLVKEYRYTNHNNCPDTADFKMYTNIDNVSLDNKFTSRALMRGLLTDEIWYSDGKKVKEVRHSYNSDPSRFGDYARSIEQFSIPGIPGYLINVPFVRYTPFKILTFYPYLESRTETMYDPSGQTVMSSVTENFTYNGNLMTKTCSKNLSDGRTETVSMTYPNDYSSSVYEAMTSKGIVSSPIETIVYEDGEVIGGTLTEYSQDKSIFFPHKTWKLSLTECLDSTDFFPFSGSAKDGRYVLDNEMSKVDEYGNPLLVHTESGMAVSYKWGYSSAYPTAIVSDASNTYKEQTVWEPSVQSRSIYLNPNNISQNVKTYTFTSYESGDVTLHLSGALGYDWFVPGTLDGKSFGLVQMRSMLPLEEPWNRYVDAYTYTFTFNGVPKGTHTLNISTPVMRRGSSEGSNDMGYMSFSYRGRVGHVETSGSDEFLYEDFESWTTADTYPFGFYSDRCLVGEYPITLYGKSDRKYILDYMVYKAGRWNYVRKHLEDRTYVIDEGLNPIDDVRVRPEDSAMETFSWYPLTGLRSRTDDSGVTESYVYDVCGRLQAVRNNSDEIVGQYDYNYAGNSQSAYPSVYGNVRMSMQFGSSLCDKSVGELPVPVTYTVPSYKYSSTESQSDANRQAFDDLIANGQKYADEHGKCESYIIVSVYNPTPEAYTLEYSWGVQGSIQYLRFAIPPGEFAEGKGGTNENIKPTVILVPRRNYRSAFIRNSDGDSVPFKAESGYTWEFYYAADYYDDYKDTYIIGE